MSPSPIINRRLYFYSVFSWNHGKKNSFVWIDLIHSFIHLPARNSSVKRVMIFINQQMDLPSASSAILFGLIKLRFVVIWFIPPGDCIIEFVTWWFSDDTWEVVIWVVIGVVTGYIEFVIVIDEVVIELICIEWFICTEEEAFDEACTLT